MRAQPLGEWLTIWRALAGVLREIGDRMPRPLDIGHSMRPHAGGVGRWHSEVCGPPNHEVEVHSSAFLKLRNCHIPQRMPSTLEPSAEESEAIAQMRARPLHAWAICQGHKERPNSETGWACRFVLGTSNLDRLFHPCEARLMPQLHER